MKAPVKLSHFLFQADVLAKSIGLIPYDDESKPPKFRRLMNCIFIVLIINLNFVVVGEIMFVVVSIQRRENFAEAVENFSYFGFAIVTNIKVITILQKKSLLTILMRNIRQLYPNELKLQEQCDARNYAIKYNLISFGFVLIHEILAWMYNLYSAANYLIYDYWLALKIVPKKLAFNSWWPWQWQDHWSYYLLYISQNIASHTSVSVQLVNDLILCAVATQIVMHYRCLAHRIETYQPTEVYEKDQLFLKECIQYHQQILGLSIYMNEVFGISLLVNFISSSLTVCFLGFHITIGVTIDMLIILLLFLFCSSVQILMICYYGEQLMEKSEGISHAVYKHNWIYTDTRYRKIMIMVIKRSQKPAILKATRFLNVSFSTATTLMQLSYKFFALLKTMYSN